MYRRSTLVGPSKCGTWDFDALHVLFESSSRSTTLHHHLIRADAQPRAQSIRSYLDVDLPEASHIPTGRFNTFCSAPFCVTAQVAHLGSSMLHLHVWGPAFGLPSIDAECLAIIAYFHNALPSSEWCLIPSNDPAVSPSNLLPALHHDGNWISGFQPIVQYLASAAICNGLDETLDTVQRADSVAYSAYLRAHAGPLIDLSLYVSAANWVATTRPAYSSLLSFPLTWTVPTLIRAEAIKRAEHLGLAELDSDFDPNGGLHLTGRDALPETFRRHIPLMTKKTIRDEMTPEQATAIRLFGLAEGCLTVLDDLMEGKSEDDPRFFFKDGTVSTLDCLAFGYLALMQKPPVPRSFLRDWLDSKTPRLHKFVDSMLASMAARGDLPWTDAAPTPVARFGGRILDSVLRHVPSLGGQYAAEMRHRVEQQKKGVDQRAAMLIVGAALAGLATGYGVQYYRALQPFGASSQTWQPDRMRTRLSDFGQLGSMLSSAMAPYQPVPSGLDLGAREHGRLVEVDSEVD
ncbi:Tom37 C-terminal domain-containing protein [Trichoderma novae-zelandiae]